MANFKIVTFNIRNVWDREGKNSFIHRVGMIYDKVNKERPDVIAFQEVLQPHVTLLERIFPDYEFHGQFRNKDFSGEGVYTAVKRSAWQVIASEAFWISPTPYVPGTIFECQSEYPRVCGVVQIRNKENGKMFRIFNIHLDHISDEARIAGIRCVIEMMDKFNEKANVPSIILGDFNAEPNSDTIKYCNEYDGTHICDLTSTLPVTFHNWGTDEQKIDYIYVTGGIEKALTNVGIWDQCHDGIYFSDHYPVFADLDMDKMD